MNLENRLKEIENRIKQGKKICKHCGKEFHPHHKLAMYCNTECRYREQIKSKG